MREANGEKKSKTPKQRADFSEMREGLRFAMVLAQFFGLMPLHGLSGGDFQFRWLSPRFFYALLNLAGAFCVVSICFVKVFTVGLMLDRSTFISFYTLNFFGMVQFVNIARNWDRVMKEWTAVEGFMKGYGKLEGLGRRFKTMTAVFMSLAVLEHLLYILCNVYTSIECESSAKYPATVYFGTAFQDVFTTVEYAHWKAALMELCNVVCTFAWNFTDLFVMLVSSGLALRFRQIAERMERNVVSEERIWREIREDYNRLARLCRTVDKYLAPLVIVSFMDNLYFICVQLYNSMKPRSGVIESVYFFYSFGFLLGRTVAVTSYAAWINDESRRPLEHLHSTSSEIYCVEINRFIYQICTCPVGITGSGYFLITRNFLLKVLGTIVTFELMLMQFGPLLKGQERSYSEHVCIIK